MPVITFNSNILGCDVTLNKEGSKLLFIRQYNIGVVFSSSLQCIIICSSPEVKLLNLVKSWHVLIMFSTWINHKYFLDAHYKSLMLAHWWFNYLHQNHTHVLLCNKTQTLVFYLSKKTLVFLFWRVDLFSLQIMTRLTTSLVIYWNICSIC